MKVDAGPAARHYRLVDGRPRTSAVVVDGRQVDVDGPEVVVVVDGIPHGDDALDVCDVEEAADHSRLAWTLTDPVGATWLSVRVVVEADRAAGVVRKRAEVSGLGRLQMVELDRWPGPGFRGFKTVDAPVEANAGPPGLGQPVFGPGLFTGVEHPGADNLVTAAGGCSCALAFEVELGAEPFVTPATVVGAGGMEAFWDYVDRLRPVPPRLVALANNWYQLGWPGLMDEATVVAEVHGFTGVRRRHGLGLDWVCLDDGWDGGWDEETGIWGRLAPSGFPGGVCALAAAGGPAGEVGIGLWVGPFGGYGERQEARVAWGASCGYEVETAYRLFCVAGDVYRAHLADALSRWVGDGVGYLKVDGVRFGCQDDGHGHPVGPGARTHQMDRFAALLRRLRAVRPDVVIAFTSGSNPSPWWLASADFLWRGGLDDTTADHPGSRLDRFDTYIDSCLEAYRDTALPVSALVTFGVVESEACTYRDAGDLDGWARHCWLTVGRGTLHHDLYVAPDSLSEDEWAVLARAIEWARAHQHVLARSRMVLGSPADGRIYGFVARRGDTATACLRNPSARTLTVDLRWPAILGLDDDLTLETVWGRRVAPEDTTLTLEPFDVLLVVGRRTPTPTPTPTPSNR